MEIPKMKQPEYELEANAYVKDDTYFVQYVMHETTTNTRDFKFMQKFNKDDLVVDVETGKLCALVPIEIREG